MSELKPCPFCKCTEIVAGKDFTRGNYRVDCLGCSAFITALSLELAIQYWNTRPIEDELTAERDEWRKDAERMANNCMDTFFAECVHCKAIEYNNIILHAPNCPITLHKKLVEKYGGENNQGNVYVV